MRQNMKTPKRANLIGLQWRGTKGVVLVISAATVWAQNAHIGVFAVAMALTPPTPPDAVKVPSRRSEGFLPSSPPPLSIIESWFSLVAHVPSVVTYVYFLTVGLDLRLCFVGVLGRAAL